MLSQGLFQEQGIVQRALDELDEDVVFDRTRSTTHGFPLRSKNSKPAALPLACGQPHYGVVFDLRYSFFLFDQIVIAVTDSVSVPP